MCDHLNFQPILYTVYSVQTPLHLLPVLKFRDAYVYYSVFLQFGRKTLQY